MSVCHCASLLLLLIGCVIGFAIPVLAQPMGKPDRGAPGDEMIQRYLQNETARISASYADDIKSRRDWEARRPQYVEEYFYMLGLSPRPEKTPLNATITGTMQRDGYVVDMLHYQSRPGLYVTGNLYRPAVVKEGERLPAVFYVCGHSGRGRDGNKVAYQSHGILVRETRLYLPGGGLAATRRDRVVSSRHVQPAAMVVAFARLHAGRRGSMERHPRDRLSDQPPRCRSEPHRRDRHQRRRSGDVLDFGGR